MEKNGCRLGSRAGLASESVTYLRVSWTGNTGWKNKKKLRNKLTKTNKYF